MSNPEGMSPEDRRRLHIQQTKQILELQGFQMAVMLIIDELAKKYPEFSDLPDKLQQYQEQTVNALIDTVEKTHPEFAEELRRDELDEDDEDDEDGGNGHLPLPPSRL